MSIASHAGDRGSTPLGTMPFYRFSKDPWGTVWGPRDFFYLHLRAFSRDKSEGIEVEGLEASTAITTKYLSHSANPIGPPDPREDHRGTTPGFYSHALPPVQAIPKGRIRSTSVPQIVDLLIKSYLA